MYLGIDIGGTNIKYGIVSEDAEIIEKNSTATKAFEGRDAVINRVVEIAATLLGSNTEHSAPGTRHSAPGTRHSIGICVPGVVDPLTRHVLMPPNLPGWTDVPLADLVREGLTRSNPELAEHLLINVENDANAAALAEHGFGAGKGHDDFIYVTLGTGIGGGIILDGKLYAGSKGGAGEIGHTIVDWKAHQLPRAFRTGVLEELAGNAGIVKRFVDRTDKADINDVAAIAQLAENGNEDAVHVMEETGMLIALGICSAFAILGVSHAVIGGGISKSDLTIRAIKKTVIERAMPTIARNATVVRAHFVNDAGLIGAAMLNRLSLPLHS